MERSVTMKEELMETLLTKIKNAFYVIDDNEYPQSEDICSLNRDEIYVYLYDTEVEKWFVNVSVNNLLKVTFKELKKVLN